MRRNLSDQEIHALYCPIKNAKSATFLVAYFSVVTIVNWRALDRPSERPSIVTLLFVIFFVALLAKWLVSFTCFRERLVLGLVIVSMVTGEVEAFVRSVFSQRVEMLRFGHLALSLLGLLVSLTMLVQSARTPKAEPNQLQPSNLRQQNFPIILALVAAILVLGLLLYFLPLRQ